jgi:hypothetical protein
MERIEEENCHVSIPVTLAVIARILITAGAAHSLAMLLWSQSMFGMNSMMGGGLQE